MRKLLYLSVFLVFLSVSYTFAQTPIWGFNLGGPGGNNWAQSCRVSANGNVLVAGGFYGTMNLNPLGTAYNITSNGSDDIFLACYTSNGIFLWGFNIGGPNSDGAYKVTTDVFNNVYISGFQQGGANFNPLGTAYILPFAGGSGLTMEGDGFVAKYSSTGVLQWAQDLGGPTVYDYNEALATDPQGNVYVGGVFDDNMVVSSSITLNSTAQGTAYLIKYNPAGVVVWAHNFGEALTGNNTIVRNIQEDNGYIYVSGFFTGEANFQPWGTASMLTADGGGPGIVSNDAFLAKYDTGCNLVFVNDIGGTGTDDEMEALVLDAADNVYLSGFTNSPSVTFNFAAPATSTVAAPGGGAQYNIMMAKYSSTGVYQWGHVFGNAAGETMGRAIDIAGGDVFFSGPFSGTVNFNSAGVANLTSAGGTDIFVTKYDLNGNYLCGFRVGGADGDAGYGLSHDNAGNIYSSGFFEGTNINFDPSGGTFPLTSTSTAGPDGYLVKYNPACVSVNTVTPCLTNSLIINTGYNPITNTAIAPGINGGAAVTDPHWIITSESPGVATAIAATLPLLPGLVEVAPGANADVVPIVGPGLWATNPAGDPGGWISCLNSNYYNDCLCGTPYYMTLGRPFRMCSDDSITLSFYIVDDNYISATDIDGTVLPFSQTPPPVFSYFSTYTYFTQTLYLTAGTHTVHFLVNNWNLTAGSPPANPTGLDVYGTVWSATGSNSLVSESSAACNAYVCGSGCNTVTMPDTVKLCQHDTATLTPTISGDDTVLAMTWSPAANLSSTTILNPVVTAVTSGSYTFTVTSIEQDELVANGDFSLGSAGFTTAYTLEGYGATSTPGDYAVDVNPNLYDAAWPVMGSYPTGTGNMLMVDGAPSATESFWCETMTVTPATSYIFTVWTALLHTPQPNIQITINGVNVSTFTTSATAAVWQPHSVVWNSGTATTANICMYDLNTVAFGNDFAVDDISFNPLCVVSDSVYVKVTPSDTSLSHSDTSICSLVGAVVLTAPASFTNYLWSTGTAGVSNITVGAGGSYWVRDTALCVLKTDTFHVTTLTPDTLLNLIPESMCKGATITLTAPTGYTMPIWSTGSTATAITVSDTGTYVVRETATCGTVYDEFTVTYKPPVIAGAWDTVKGCLYLVDFLASPTGTEYSYLWSGPADFTSTMQNPVIQSGGSANEGVYTVTVTDNATGCDGKATTTLVITPIPPVPLTNVSPTQTITYGGSVQLNADNALYYWWLPNDGTISNRNINDPVVSPTTTTVYTVYGMDSLGCVDSAKITVEVLFDSISIPSAFTPNGDGLNDVFRPLGMTYQSLVEFSVYNRWGQRVFTTSNKEQGWDGTFNGVKQDMDVYNYMLIVALEDGSTRMYKGNVTLVR